MNLFNFEEMKIGFIRQAKQQRCSGQLDRESAKHVLRKVLETEIRLPGY